MAEPAPQPEPTPAAPTVPPAPLPAGMPWPPLASEGAPRQPPDGGGGAAVTGYRTLRVAVDLPRGEGAPAPDLAGLIAALQGLADDPAIGGDATVSRISGQVDHFTLDLSKPDLP
jgi:hypothetical protein